MTTPIALPVRFERTTDAYLSNDDAPASAWIDAGTATTERGCARMVARWRRERSPSPGSWAFNVRAIDATGAEWTLRDLDAELRAMA